MMKLLVRGIRANHRLSPPALLRGAGNREHRFSTVAFEEIEAAATDANITTQTAFILHGLLGSARNWRTFARQLTSSLLTPSSAWRIVLVDLRNHGKSNGIQGLNPPHDMGNAARDLATLIEGQRWGWPDVVIGHSMGGKVALEYAASCARGDYGGSAVLPKQLWVLDSVPGEVNSDNDDGEVERVLRTLQSLATPFPSRRWLVEHMAKQGFSKPLSEWIGSNLKKAYATGEQMTWTFNLDGCLEMFNSYRQTNYWPLLENPPNRLETVVVRAEKSDRWTPQVVQKLESMANTEQTGGADNGRVLYHVLPNAGHWVHVDNPKGLLDIMVPRIKNLSP